MFISRDVSSVTLFTSTPADTGVFEVNALSFPVVDHHASPFFSVALREAVSVDLFLKCPLCLN